MAECSVPGARGGIPACSDPRPTSYLSLGFFAPAASTEAFILKHIEHPNIIRFRSSMGDRWHRYMAMELCSGGHLQDDLVRRGKYPEVRLLFSVPLAARKGRSPSSSRVPCAYPSPLRARRGPSPPACRSGWKRTRRTRDTRECSGDGPIGRRSPRARFFARGDQSDAGSVDILSQRTHQTQGAWLYSHEVPCGRARRRVGRDMDTRRVEESIGGGLDFWRRALAER
eukprot:273014-Prorocentrum_minimum.AAC.2